MPTKDQLIELIQLGQVEILRLVERMGEVERAQSGTPEHWSARDILAHIGEGNRSFAKDLERCRQGLAPEEADFEAENRSIYEQYRQRGWEEFFALLESSHLELVEQIGRCTDEELNEPDRYAWLNGRPLWRYSAGLGFLHPMSHLFQAHLDRGDRAFAERVGENELRLSLQFDLSPIWQGTAIYNQACRQALLGKTKDALDLLEKTFILAPNLRTFAPQDSDLAVLHPMAEFKLLVEKQA